VHTLSNSYIVHPILHMSEAVSYCFSTMETSGALYHLDPIWFDKLLFLLIRVSLFFTSFWTIVFYNSSSLPLSSFHFYIQSRNLLEFPLPWPIVLSGIVLARPKSQNRILQSSLIKILAGLRSLCKTFAEWRYFIPHSMLYKIDVIWSSESYSSGIELYTFLRSLSIYSITKKRPCFSRLEVFWAMIISISLVVK